MSFPSKIGLTFVEDGIGKTNAEHPEKTLDKRVASIKDICYIE